MSIPHTDESDVELKAPPECFKPDPRLLARALLACNLKQISEIQMLLAKEGIELHFQTATIEIVEQTPRLR